MIEGTGQSALPAIELEDGTWYREQSGEMEKRDPRGPLRPRPPPERRYTFSLAGL